MRQCLLTWVLLALIFGVNLSGAEKEAHDYSSIQKASIFSIGSVGFAGRVAVAETTTRQLLKRVDAEEVLLNLWNEAAPAGRMYILLGLKGLKSKAFDEKANLLSKSRERIKTCSGGCMVFEEEVNVVVAAIRGKYTLQASQPISGKKQAH
jgi:hypothetical protein